MTTDRDFRWCEVSHDYYSRLHQFECAVPKDGVSDARHTYIEGYEARHNKLYPVWQLEVQSAIRDFRKPSNPRSQWAHICVQPDGKGNDRIRSFVWFGIENGTKKDNNGMYIIGYIARSLDAKGCYFGDFTLKHALRICRDDHAKTGRSLRSDRQRIRRRASHAGTRTAKNDEGRRQQHIHSKDISCICGRCSV